MARPLPGTASRAQGIDFVYVRMGKCCRYVTAVVDLFYRRAGARFAGSIV